jgi:hypothetical protein
MRIRLKGPAATNLFAPTTYEIGAFDCDAGVTDLSGIQTKEPANNRT